MLRGHLHEIDHPDVQFGPLVLRKLGLVDLEQHCLSELLSGPDLRQSDTAAWLLGGALAIPVSPSHTLRSLYILIHRDVSSLQPGLWMPLL